MTIEKAKELLPIIQAYAEGKTIQQKRQVGYKDEWFDVNFPLWDESPSNYRIKPEVKYRPFKTKEECCNEMFKHQPFGWVIYDEKYYNICGVTPNEIIILYECVPCCFDFESCTGSITFTDGTPFGIKKN